MNNKIILCEDELIISLDIKQGLKKYGFEVSRYFTSAEEALKYINKYRPDMVITNMKLGGKLNGIEFAKLLLEKCNLKVLMISGDIDNQSLLNNKNFLQLKKPFTTEEMISKVKYLLNH